MKEAEQSFRRAVASLTSSGGAHRAIRRRNGEVAALRARLQALEDRLSADHAHHGAPKTGSQHPDDRGSAITGDAADARRSPQLDAAQHDLQERGSSILKDGPAVHDDVPAVDKGDLGGNSRMRRSERRSSNFTTKKLTISFKTKRIPRRRPTLDLLHVQPLRCHVSASVVDADVRLAKLKGMPLNINREILNNFGYDVGHGVESGKKLLQGYAPNDRGEIFDDDGDAVGRVEAV